MSQTDRTDYDILENGVTVTVTEIGNSVWISLPVEIQPQFPVDDGDEVALIPADDGSGELRLVRLGR